MERLIHVDRCDSTQDLLKEQLTQDPFAEFTISCDEQQQGRGRGAKNWQDGAGTICFSLNLEAHPQPSFTALELSVLIARFFEKKGQVTQLKWPNDLLNHENKKCAGILVQNISHQYLAGIGVNVFLENSEFGGIYQAPFHLDKKEWAQEMARFIRQHRYRDTQLLIRDWTARCSHLDRTVKITEGEQVIQGLFEGLGKYGEALIKNDQGSQAVFNGSLRLV